MLKYSCEYPVTTALQGTLALPAIPWLEVAGATYSKIGNLSRPEPATKERAVL